MNKDWSGEIFFSKSKLLSKLFKFKNVMIEILTFVPIHLL